MSLASDARAIARAGIRAVEPRFVVSRALARHGDRLEVAGTAFPLVGPHPLRVAALGKAASTMAEAVRARAAGRIRGIAIHPEGGRAAPGGFLDLEGGHPLPDARSRAAARALLAFLAEDVSAPVLFLISGGGSAVLEEPAPGVPFPALRATTRLLLGSTAPITDMNAIRRHLSAVKGGQLLRPLSGAPSVTLAISDVIGDTPEDIASGPTVPDPTTYRDARRAAERHAIWRALPPVVRRHLERGIRGELPETPKPGDPIFRGHRFRIIASNGHARRGAARAARARGYRVTLEERPVLGETAPAARRLARELLRAARAAGASGRRRALIWGGETTVRLGPHPGRGGRNQELVLAAAHPLRAAPGVLLLSVGTDGVDGPTDAAGGWVDGDSARRARALGLDLVRRLREHESYDTLRRLGTLWRIGPTGTNVTDLHVGLAAPVARRPGRQRG